MKDESDIKGQTSRFLNISGVLIACVWSKKNTVILVCFSGPHLSERVLNPT